MENILVKNLNRQGKLGVAKKIFLATLLELKNQKKKIEINPFLAGILSGLQPKIGFRTKKVAGTLYKIPIPYQNLTRLNLAGKWLVAASRHQKGQPIDKKLAREVLDASSLRGEASRKRRDIHRLAIANKTNLKYM